MTSRRPLPLRERLEILAIEAGLYGVLGCGALVVITIVLLVWLGPALVVALAIRGCS